MAMVLEMSQNVALNVRRQWDDAIVCAVVCCIVGARVLSVQATVPADVLPVIVCCGFVFCGIFIMVVVGAGIVAASVAVVGVCIASVDISDVVAAGISFTDVVVCLYSCKDACGNGT